MHLLGRDAARAQVQLEAIRSRSGNVKEARYLAAQIAVVQREPDKALKELEALLDQEPIKAPVYVDIGQVYLLKKDYGAAESALKKALAVDTKFNRAHVVLAQLYVAMGEQSKEVIGVSGCQEKARRAFFREERSQER